MSIQRPSVGTCGENTSVTLKKEGHSFLLTLPLPPFSLPLWHILIYFCSFILMVSFNIFQQVFVVFFAVLYGFMFLRLEALQPFPFATLRKLAYGEITMRDVTLTVPQMKKCKQRRMVLSFLTLILLPFAYFLFALDFLSRYDSSFVQSFVNPSEVYWMIGFASIFFSLSIFAFHQIYLVFAHVLQKHAFCDLAQEEHAEYFSRDVMMNAVAAIFYFILPWILIFIFEMAAH